MKLKLTLLTLTLLSISHSFAMDKEELITSGYSSVKGRYSAKDPLKLIESIERDAENARRRAAGQVELPRLDSSGEPVKPIFQGIARTLEQEIEMCDGIDQMPMMKEVDSEVICTAHQYGSSGRSVKVNWYTRIFGCCFSRCR